ncbi:hypothetical protein MP638_003099 [Amoeboaphelidium occidentale]|nr:hypothetical protein MP638_003099 [Amoeboaphelidium occidentale]
MTTDLSSKLKFRIALFRVLILSGIVATILRYFYVSNIWNTEVGDVPDDDRIDLSDGFLFYLPHSGFVNQLIELENALLIAYITRRTLILPPFYVSFLEIPFEGYDKLTGNIGLADMMVGKYACNDHGFMESLLSGLVPSSLFKKKAEVLGNYTSHRYIIPFDSLFDRSRFPQGVKVMSIAEFLETEEKILTDGSYTIFKERSRYGFRYTESIPGSKNEWLVDNSMEIFTNNASLNDAFDTRRYLTMFSNGTSSVESYESIEDLSKKPDIMSVTPYEKYQHIVNLQAFKNLKPLVILSSAFFIDRVYARLETTKKVQAEITNALEYSNPVLDQITDKIVSVLGDYVGVHIRGSDNRFKDSLQETFQNMASNLNSSLCSNTEFDSKCLKRPLRLFIATDVDYNLIHSSFKPLLPAESTIFTLGDFKEAILSLESLSGQAITNGTGLTMNILQKVAFNQTNFDSKLTGNYGKISISNTCKGYKESVNSKSLWYPFLDQTIAARGYAFIGTKGSSYSQRIALFHKGLKEKPFILPFA